jgi:hypothetical protein
MIDNAIEASKSISNRNIIIEIKAIQSYVFIKVGLPE